MGSHSVGSALGKQEPVISVRRFQFASKVFLGQGLIRWQEKVALCYPISVDLLVTPVRIKLLNFPMTPGRGPSLVRYTGNIVPETNFNARLRATSPST